MKSNCNICSLYPCKNNGTCRYNVSSEQSNCICSANYTGRICEKHKQSCVWNQSCGLCNDSVCLNRGRCIETSATEFECKCSANYTGKNCEMKDNICKQNKCRNNATCTIIDGSSFKCNCSANYTGQLCEIKKSVCQNNTCLNGGTCKPMSEGFNCTCLSNFTGLHCEKNALNNSLDACLSSPCKNNGSCKRFNSTYKCICVKGFNGEQCEFTGFKKVDSSEDSTTERVNDTKVGVVVTIFVVIILLFVVCGLMHQKKNGRFPFNRNSGIIDLFPSHNFERLDDNELQRYI